MRHNGLSEAELHADNVTVEGYVDGLETLVTSSNTKLDQVHTDLVAATPAGTNVVGFTVIPTTIDTSITRTSDTNAYATNDCWADSTSAPTTGGFTITGAARASGKSGKILSATITSTADPAAPLQGEVWIFDQAVTAVNDNAAFALSDGDIANLVTIIPFSLLTSTTGSGTNSAQIISNINEIFTCSGTANLRCLIKVKNAYAPASAEVLKIRLKIEQYS